MSLSDAASTFVEPGEERGALVSEEWLDELPFLPLPLFLWYHLALRSFLRY